MKMSRRLALFLMVATLIASLIGCARTPTTNPPAPVQETKITVTDGMARQVTVAKKAERIISLAPSNTEILFALGLDKSVVGVTDICDFPAEAKQKEKVGGFSKPSVEKIISLKPDLVIAASLHKDTVEQLEKSSIPVYVANAKTIAQVEEEIKAIGKLSGVDQKANDVVTAMESKKKSITDKLANLAEKDKPVVYYEVWGEPITTAGPGSFHHELITLAGGVNVAAKSESSYPNYSLESLISAQPQIMIYGHGAQTKDEVLKRAGWGSMPFVKGGKVFLVDENTISRPGPRTIDALEMIAKVIHPDLVK